MDIAEQKAVLRENVRAKRKSIEAEVRKAHEEALEVRLLNLPAIKQAKHIAVYSPVGSEARFVSNLDKLYMLDQHPVIAFPLLCAQGEMVFAKFDMDDDRSVLVKPLTIIENIDPERVIDPKSIDVMLVPGLAFDKHGARLGQGGGYYDHYLPLMRDDCLIVGVAFDEQIVDEVPCERTDCKVGYVVTPTRVISAEK